MRFRPTLDALAARDVPAALHFNGGNLLLDDPAGLNDSLTVAAQGSSLVLTDAAGISLDLSSGFPTGWAKIGNTAAGPKGTVLDLTIDTGAGNDTVNVQGGQAPSSAFPVAISTGDGNDAVNLQGYAAAWAGGVSVDGGSGYDTLTLSPGWAGYAGAVNVERVQ